jgi:hypothetical protein
MLIPCFIALTLTNSTPVMVNAKKIDNIYQEKSLITKWTNLVINNQTWQIKETPKEVKAKIKKECQ